MLTELESFSPVTVPQVTTAATIPARAGLPAGALQTKFVGSADVTLPQDVPAARSTVQSDPKPVPTKVR